jgi:hypothetical protein
MLPAAGPTGHLHWDVFVTPALDTIDATRRMRRPWRRIRGACTSPRLGAANGASPPAHLYRRAGHRCGSRLRFIEAAAAHAARRAPHRVVERARKARANQFRTAPPCHAGSWRVAARSGKGSHHARVGDDHIRRLAGCRDEHRADVLGSWKRRLRVPRDVSSAWRTEASVRVVAQGVARTPGRRSEHQRRASLGRAILCRAVHADDRHLDRTVLAGRVATKPAVWHTPVCSHSDVEDFVDRLARKLNSGEGALLTEVTNRNASASAVSRSPTPALAVRSIRSCGCSASRAFMSWTEA